MSNPEPASEQVLNTTTEPAFLGPLTRWLRTILQVAVALIAAVPTMAALFNVSAEKSAQITAGMGALVALVSAIHNAINSKTSPTIVDAQITVDRGDVALGLVFRLLALAAFVIVALVGFDVIHTVYVFGWLGLGLAAWLLSTFV